MASISGTISGLAPQVDPAWEAEQARRAKKSAQPKFDECTCVACGAKGIRKYGTRSKQKWIEINQKTICLHCAKFFGLVGEGMFGKFSGGQTDENYKKAIAKIAQTNEDKYVMMLITSGFGAPDGRTIRVEAGDIFPVHRAGLQGSWEDHPDRNRTKTAFTCSIMVGGNELILFPHEFSPINFIAVMDLRARGEILESFVSPGDPSGYFAPVPEVRAQIRAAFGL